MGTPVPMRACVCLTLPQVLRMFLLSTILLGVIVLLLIYSNVALFVYHPPTYSRPFDMALIHAPLRFFMILPLSLLFPYSLLYVLASPHHHG